MKEIEEKNRTDKKLKSATEFLSGMTKEDFLQPVFGVVFYRGEDSWDGPESIAEMVHLPDELERLREYIPLYKIHLLDSRIVNLDDLSGV